MSTEQMQNTNMDGQENTAAEADVSMERYLTFRSDGTTMGVSTDYVIEILTDQIITEIPMVPEFIKYRESSICAARLCRLSICG